MTYTPHTQPYELQQQTWESTRDRTAYCLFWEQGTGKTKLAVDTAGHLFCTGKIDAVFVVAPTDIHANWDVPNEGVQKHLPPELLKAAARVTWNSGKAASKGAQRDLAALLAHKDGMRWLFMGFDALNTERGYAAARAFLTTYRCLWVMDEAGRIANPKTKRSKAVMKLRALAPYARSMTGTPVTQKPFSVYNIVHWMNPTYWRQNGIGNHFAFTHHFGVWRKIRVNMGREVEVQKTDRDGRPVYQNLDQLTSMLRPISSRVLKTEMVDLPPKVYTRLYYELTARQRAMYDKLEEEYIIWYTDNTRPDEDNPDGPRLFTTSADLTIVRQLRLQQLALGYLTTDEGEMVLCGDVNPALDLLTEVTEDLSHQAIIWGRFRKDTELICGALGERAVRYDGSVGAEDRVRAVQAFQAGDKQFFVGTQSTAGEGLTLTAAQTAIYYSNSRKLRERLQSEDRCHRIGSKGEHIQYIDLLARNTIAEDILEGLLYGQDVAATVLGDKMRRRRGH